MSDAVLEPGALLLVPRPREVVWARGASAGTPEREWVEIDSALVGELEAARRAAWNGETAFVGAHLRLEGFGEGGGAGGAMRARDEGYELKIETGGGGSAVLRTYVEFFTRRYYYETLIHSLAVSAIATVLATRLGAPLADSVRPAGKAPAVSAKP